jgi:hypothetical protein
VHRTFTGQELFDANWMVANVKSVFRRSPHGSDRA